MTRRSRRASSAPQRVGSDEGLTSTHVRREAEPDDRQAPGGSAPAESPAPPTVPDAQQTKDDTDEGWGERGDDDASARWLRENRPPHWS
ncbi:hypothetical protein ACOCJ4_03395 [Knoellia sp. CPCC 206435]|uniref:hypothetical protein n=1 Tax=Knoellia terrae TaxID=3404797 RepID=UPI003B428D8D